MAVEADRVVVEIFAKVDQAQADVNRYTNSFVANLVKQENGLRSLLSAEDQTSLRISERRSRLADQLRRNDGEDNKLTERAIARRLRLAEQVRKSADVIDLNARRVAASQRNLGFQISDVGQQLGGGQSPFVIFAQQAPQFVQAFEDIKASGAGLGAVLKGVALPGFVAVLSIAAPFIAKLFEGEKAAKVQKTALERLTDALEEYQKQTGQATQTEVVRLSIMEKTTAQLAQQEINTRKLIKARIDALKLEQQVLENQARAGTPDANRQFKLQNIQSAIPDLDRKLADQDKKIAIAEREARVAAGRLATVRNQEIASSGDEVAQSAARAAKANNDYAITVAKLERRLRLGPDRLDTKGRPGIDAATFQRLQLEAQQRRDAILNADANAGKGKARERAADAAARKAESDRIRDVRDNEAFQNDLATLNDQLLEAQKSQVEDAGKLAQFEKDRVAEEGRKRQQQIDADLAAKKYNPAQADLLSETNKRVVAERTKAIDLALEETRRKEALSAAQADLKNQADLVSAQSALATTAEERKDVSLRLLDLQYQQERLDLEGIIASKDANEAQKKVAQARLALLPALQSIEEAGIARQNQGAGAAYLRSLSPTRGERLEMFDERAVGYLEAFNRGLDDSVKKALNLHGVFGDIIGDLIDMAIKQAPIKPLAAQLFGPEGSGASGGGGLLGKLVSAGSSLFGGKGSFAGVGSDSFKGGFDFTAGGGNSGFVAIDPSDYHYNPDLKFASGGSFAIGGRPGVDKNILSLNGRPVARVSRGETAHIVPQAKRIGQGVGSAMRPGQSVTVISAPQFDLSKAVTTFDLMREVDRVSQANAQAAAAAMGRGVLKAVPARVRQYQVDES